MLVLVDAVGGRAATPVSVIAPGVKLLVKRPGELVVLDAPGFSKYTASFDTPATPAPGSVAVQLDIRPANPGYGARRFALSLPRDPDPAHAASDASLFRPVEIPLLPSPQATVTGLVAALRVTVTRSDDNRRIEGALVRLRPEGGRPQAVALTDSAGDALLLIAGIPLASPGPGGVVRSDIGAQLDAIVDPVFVRFHTIDEIDGARAAAARRNSALTDPDDVEKRFAAKATAPKDVRIAPGQTRTAAIAWTPV
jgi:hypothetical protein